METRLYTASKIKSLRKASKLTQKEFGKILGYENNTISAIERGVMTIYPETLYKLSCTFDVPISYFFPKH